MWTVNQDWIDEEERTQQHIPEVDPMIEKTNKPVNNNIFTTIRNTLNNNNYNNGKHKFTTMELPRN